MFDEKYPYIVLNGAVAHMYHGAIYKSSVNTNFSLVT